MFKIESNAHRLALKLRIQKWINKRNTLAYRTSNTGTVGKKEEKYEENGIKRTMNCIHEEREIK
jgi:hypothetical protein